MKDACQPTLATHQQHQDQQTALFTRRNVPRKQPSKNQNSNGVVVKAVLVIATIVAVIAVQLVVIIEGTQQSLQNNADQQEITSPMSLETAHPPQSQQVAHYSESKAAQLQLSHKTQGLSTDSDFFSEEQKQLRSAQIRSQMTKRKIYINKFIENYSPTSNTSNSITTEQFLRAIALTNASGTAGASAILEEERTYYEKKYGISQYKELPFCIVVPTYNNYKQFKYFFNAHSILQQHYSLFRTIFIDDASTDSTADGIQEILAAITTTQRVQLVRNQQRRGHMANIYHAVHNFCQRAEILMIVDGDDQLIGRQVLQLLNAYYQQTKALSIYTNHVRAVKNADFLIGTSEEYPAEVKREGSYRWAHHSYSHLKTTWVNLFLEISPDSLKDEQGNWFTNAVDNAFYFCVLELSCGRVEYLPELTYKYNMFTGNNIFEQARKSERASNSVKIRNKTAYSCIASRNAPVYNSIQSLLS